MSAYDWKYRAYQDFGPVSGREKTIQGGSVLTDRNISGSPFSGQSRQSTWTRENQPELGLIREFKRRHRSDTADVRAHSAVWSEDVGGAFTTITQRYKDNGGFTSPVRLTATGIGNTRYTYDGPLFARYTSFGPTSTCWPAIDLKSMSDDMTQLGTTAISRVLPTHPVAGVAQSIGEIREGLPSIPGRAILGRPGKVSKRFADDYLNLQFGIKPIISDMKAYAQAITQTRKILEQLERDSGRLIRRRYDFPITSTTVRMNADGETRAVSPAINTNFYRNASGPYEWTRQTVTRTWFSGCFQYYYPTDVNLMSSLSRAETAMNRLYGTRVTPELLWELTPWSWALDWVANTGDVMTNLSTLAHDGLVMRWGYVMQTKSVRDTHSVVADLYSGRRLLKQTFETVVKRRLKALPYGFGMDPDWKDLSSRQFAILGALGIHRGR